MVPRNAKGPPAARGALAAAYIQTLNGGAGWAGASCRTNGRPASSTELEAGNWAGRDFTSKVIHANPEGSD